MNLATELGASTFQEMMDMEVLRVTNIQYKFQKMVFMNKLNNDLFNGKFWDAFVDCAYGNFLLMASTVK